ncbi:DoxX family protein [Asticcacaulis sp. ZE23SCel15]|uniref:DoxX family protein n=1 Tax=Asticcacaulis sp. ZE23SCel15 TaxID=3059027 RepID=UPI00265E430E|nr:DoxX family protein [Asticcacaulis sp. ZE23SCel15]WKL58929.1 DoxX family protein [Asticcacaulis sp. ZE23SCel15]
MLTRPAPAPSNPSSAVRYDAYRLSRLYTLPEVLSAPWWLLARLWIGWVFFVSGLTKIADFDTTISLFADEYQVPVLPPEFAAFSATAFELICPVLIWLGLGTRLAAIPLLVMTAVIQFTYLQHDQHLFWAIILTGLIIHGGGKWSADHLIAQRLKA